MKPSQILRKAKALIDSPEKWLKGSYAADEHGNALQIDNQIACKFCSVGALQKICDDANVYFGAMFYLGRETSNNVAIFNDTHTHAEVMAKWDEAIALAETDEKKDV